MNPRSWRRAAHTGFCALVALGFGSDARAEMSVAEYQRATASGTVPATTKLYILGLGDGLTWASALQVAHGASPPFCPPSNVAMEVDDYVLLLNREIGRYPAAFSKDAMVGMFLARALRRAYPCNN